MYFVWQGVTYFTWNPTMRYLLLIYPTLAIIAAWAVFELGKRAPVAGRGRPPAAVNRWARLRPVLAWTIGQPFSC
jgi:hypothetical protein